MMSGKYTPQSLEEVVINNTLKNVTLGNKYYQHISFNIVYLYHSGYCIISDVELKIPGDDIYKSFCDDGYDIVLFDYTTGMILRDIELKGAFEGEFEDFSFAISRFVVSKPDICDPPFTMQEVVKFIDNWVYSVDPPANAACAL